MMFSSRPPYKERGQVHVDTDGMVGRLNYSFDRPQNNPTNPILLAVRRGEVSGQEVLDAFAPGFDQFAYRFSASMIDHAARVMTRLTKVAS